MTPAEIFTALIRIRRKFDNLMRDMETHDAAEERLVPKDDQLEHPRDEKRRLPAEAGRGREPQSGSQVRGKNPAETLQEVGSLRDR